MTTRTELRTERLLLRPFHAEDAADARAYRDDPEFARFLPHIPHQCVVSNLLCGIRVFLVVMMNTIKE